MESIDIFMMNCAKDVLSRFVNLLEIQRYTQKETIRSDFSEPDLKIILRILNDYIGILEDNINQKEGDKDESLHQR